MDASHAFQGLSPADRPGRHGLRYAAEPGGFRSVTRRGALPAGGLRGSRLATMVSVPASRMEIVEMKRAFNPVSGRCLITLVAALCSLAPALVHAQARDSGAFVIRLGNDTVAIERYTLTGNRLEAVSITRSPRTVVRRYVATLADDGSVARYAADLDGRTLDERAPAVAQSVPLSGQFWVPWELALRKAVRAGRDTVTVTLQTGDQARPTLFQRTSPDTWAFANQFDVPATARVDRWGRILAVDAGGGSTVARVAQMNVDRFATEFSRRDEAGRGLGPLSPRDTTRATIAGATLLVDYSRPSLRGRALELLVPNGQIWRTGANDATHFRTDRTLIIGESTVPAGTYTFYTLPAADGWTLIINRQTGQSGTEYDQGRDLVRVPMRTREGAYTEQFTIDLTTSGNSGAIVLRWGRVEASVPFRLDG